MVNSYLCSYDFTLQHNLRLKYVTYTGISVGNYEMYVSKVFVYFEFPIIYFLDSLDRREPPCGTASFIKRTLLCLSIYLIDIKRVLRNGFSA